MDIHMPVMDGLEATRELRRLGNPSPIIALTANIMKHDRENYLLHGIEYCLGKPFKAQELWACLLQHLEDVSEPV